MLKSTVLHALVDFAGIQHCYLFWWHLACKGAAGGNPIRLSARRIFGIGLRVTRGCQTSEAAPFPEVSRQLFLQVLPLSISRHLTRKYLHA